MVAGIVAASAVGPVGAAERAAERPVGRGTIGVGCARHDGRAVFALISERETLRARCGDVVHVAAGVWAVQPLVRGWRCRPDGRFRVPAGGAVRVHCAEVR
jgi:hypothetical protein